MIVDCAVYQSGLRRPGQVDLPDAFDAVRDDPDAFVWIGLHEPEPEELEAVVAEFGLHPLAVEDAINGQQRPKLEVYDDSLFCVLRTARYHESREQIDFAEIQLFIGDRFVVTVRHGEASELAGVRKRLEKDAEVLACGPMAVLHAALDRVVDDYEPVIDELDLDLVQVEETVFSADRHNPAERIYLLKRQVLELYRNVEPLLEPLDRLANGKTPFHIEELATYFRDVDDHLRREVGRIRVMRDLLSDALDVNLAHISVRQNDDMRRISGWVAIVAIPTMLAGVWGMNFEHMPELGWAAGYPLALVFMFGSSYLVFRRLRRQGWI